MVQVTAVRDPLADPPLFVRRWARLGQNSGVGCSFETSSLASAFFTGAQRRAPAQLTPARRSALTGGVVSRGVWPPRSAVRARGPSRSGLLLQLVCLLSLSQE